MFTIVFVEKSSYISEYFESLDKSRFSVISFQSIEEALSNIEKYNPNLIVLVADKDEELLFNFCKKIREKYSLVLPILLVLDFYSSFTLEQFRDLGVDFLVKPFTQQEFKKKIESLLPTQTKEFVYERETEIIERLKPYIKQEVRSEMQIILKQILEVMERKNV
ncbi:MAG: hypothetical protein ABDH19_07740 [Thermodesulfovibrio sp.]